MKKILYVIAAAAAVLAAASCSTIDKMTKMAEQVTVTCEPSVLEVVAGEIDATVSVTYPAGYFNPKAIVKVTPVIVYEGGEASMKEFVYQGEKVKDNYKLVSSDGQTVTEKVHFDYVKGMEKCYLELRSTVLFGKKDIPLPVKKVADGANTTYMLVKDKGVVSLSAQANSPPLPSRNSRRSSRRRKGTTVPWSRGLKSSLMLPLKELRPLTTSSPRTAPRALPRPGTRLQREQTLPLLR